MILCYGRPPCCSKRKPSESPFPGEVHTKHQRTLNFNIPGFTNSQLACALVFPFREARNRHASILCPQSGAEQWLVPLPKPDPREATPALRGAQARVARAPARRGPTDSPDRRPQGPTSRGPEQPVPRGRGTRPRDKSGRWGRGLQWCPALRPGPPPQRGVRGHGGRARWRGGSARPHRAEEVAAAARENEEAADPAALREGPVPLRPHPGAARHGRAARPRAACREAAAARSPAT